MMSCLEFDCKLAHKSEIKRISGFGSVRQLYHRISQTFSVPMDEILFCTLNTHNFRDMNSLLGNYLSQGDLIIVHMCGASESLSFKKTFEFLGLTITDNGFGRAFIKRVSSQDHQITQSIKPGQHIAAINSESTVGLRHFEVARTLREVPMNSEFTMSLIEPLFSQDSDDERYSIHYPDATRDGVDRTTISMLKLTDNDHQNDEYQCPFALQSALSGSYSLSDDAMNSSLPMDRLLTHTGTHTKDQGNYKLIIEEINSILESFLGINDTTLAIQIYRLAKENKGSFNNFVDALRSSELSIFKFGPDTEINLWKCASFEPVPLAAHND